jgi:hypothetical protein
MKIILWIIAFILFTLAVLQGLLKPVDLAVGGFLIKLGENHYSSIFYWFRFLGHWNISIPIQSKKICHFGSFCFFSHDFCRGRIEAVYKQTTAVQTIL